MPKFKASIGLPLARHFKELGVQLAFDEQRADFADIAAEPDLPFWIDEVHHCVVVDVNEEGTEAAAVTMTAMMGGSFDPPKPKQFKVDRPFLFYVTDETSGIILFQGKVADPRLL
jgi:serpin B